MLGNPGMLCFAGQLNEVGNPTLIHDLLNIKYYQNLTAPDVYDNVNTCAVNATVFSNDTNGFGRTVAAVRRNVSAHYAKYGFCASAAKRNLTEQNQTGCSFSQLSYG